MGERIILVCYGTSEAGILHRLLEREDFSMDKVRWENEKLEGDRSLYQFIYDEGWLRPERFLDQIFIRSIELRQLPNAES